MIRHSSRNGPGSATHRLLTNPIERALILGHSRNIDVGGMLPLYAARIKDLGSGDLVKVDCAACHHVALLTPEVLQRLGRGGFRRRSRNV